MPDFTVASTTDTQEAVNQAAGAVQEPEVEEKEPVKQPEAPKEPEKAAEPRDRVPRGVEKRIDRLTKEKYELQERLSALEKQVQTQRQPEPAKVEPEPVQVSPETKPKPKQEDFNTYEEWVEAVSDWKFDQRIAKMAAEQQQQEAAEAEREIEDIYKERVADFRKNHADWDEVMTAIGEVSVGPGIIPAIKELDNGPEVAYYLGKHPETITRLNQMNPYTAIAEVGRLAATIGRDEAINTPGFRTDRLPVSSAPAPIKPLTGHSTKSTKNLDEMDYQDYRKMRDQQEKSRYRR